MIVKCDFCNNNIKRSPSKINNHNFCSRKCYDIWQSKNLCGENNPRWNREGINCKECGNEFYIIPSIIKKDGNFCSIKCRSNWQSKNFIGKNNPFYGRHHSNDTKNKLSYPKSEETKNKIRSKAIGRMHSDATLKKMSESQSGERNHMYVHGDSKRKYCYKFLGKNGVKERSLLFFNNKCIECGKSQEENNKKLSVHHVYYRKMSCCENKEEYEGGVKKIGDILYIKDKNIESIHKIVGPHEKFAVLCNSCHAKTTTHNRPFWIKYFEDKINKLYNGKSYYTKKEFEQIYSDTYLNRSNKNIIKRGV